MIGALILILITLFIPPIGVAMVAGCGVDLIINICLTILGYFPGHIHAFYIEYVYYDRREQARRGVAMPPASGVYSERVQRQQLLVPAGAAEEGAGARPPGYGTV